MTGTKVFRNGKQMTALDLAQHANAVHQMAGGNGKPFTENMFVLHDGDKQNPYRLSGDHCACGWDDSVEGSPSLGEFDLFSLTDVAVREGGKAYMKCRKCGCCSHL